MSGRCAGSTRTTRASSVWRNAVLKKKGVKADKEKQHSEKKNVQQDSYKF